MNKIILIYFINYIILCQTNIRKCCPQFQYLQILKNSDRISFYCVDYFTKRNFTNLKINSNYFVHCGYYENINYKKINQIGSITANTDKFCIDSDDKYDFYKIYCDSEVPWNRISSYTNNVDLTIVRKCCKNYEFYNEFTGQCIEKYYKSRDIFNKITSNGILISAFSPPVCNSDNEVLVIEKILNKNLVITNEQTIKFNKNQEIDLLSKSYCLDDGINDSLIVKYCKPKTFCEKNLCISKCCPFNQIRKNQTCDEQTEIRHLIPVFHTQTDRDWNTGK